MSALPKEQAKRYTPDEYFKFLDTTEEKYEYENGNIKLMAGGTDNHNVIKMDLGIYLGRHAEDHTDCEPYDSDAAVYIPTLEPYVFTDLLFVCEDEVKYQDEAKRRLMNPTLIFEVLTGSTESYDRGG